MHEYSIVSALLDRVEREARDHGALSVAMVRLSVGRVAGVECELLRTAFELAREGTVAAAAELEILEIEPRWSCRVCGGEVPLEGPRRCPVCAGAARLDRGAEIVLERLELEVA